MKNTVQGTNTVCQFNVNKTPGYNKGYNNVPFPIYESPTTVDSWVHTHVFELAQQCWINWILIKYRYTTLQQQDTAVVLSGKTVHKYIKIQSLEPIQVGLYWYIILGLADICRKMYSKHRAQLQHLFTYACISACISKCRPSIYLKKETLEPYWHKK